MNVMKAAFGIFTVAMITFTAQESRAERIRTCNFVMTDTVALLDAEFNVVGTFDEVMVGTTAGRHGGVQANTARGRARDRFNTCRSRWIFGSDPGATPSFQINECRNSNVGSNSRNDLARQSSNRSYRDYIAGVFGPEVCAFAQNRGLELSELSLIAIGNDSETSGDNRCGSSRSDDLGRFGRFIARLSDLCS